MAVDGIHGRSMEKTPTVPLARSEIEKSESALRVKTYKVTLSPKGDINDECLVKIKAQCKKHLYAYAVLERGKSGQLHCHIAAVSHIAKETKHLKEPWSNMIKKHHPDSSVYYACKLNVMYDNKWYEEYLNKEEGRQVIYDKYDPEVVRSCFPSQEVQNALQIIHTNNRVGDKSMADHETKWIEYEPTDSSYESALKYLNYRMNYERSMQVYHDHRRLCQLAYALYRYRNKMIEPDAEMINFGARMTANSDVTQYIKK